MNREINRRLHDWKHMAWSLPGWAALVICLFLIGPSVLGNRAELLDTTEGRKLGATASCNRDRAFIAEGRRLVLAGVLLPGDKLDAEGGFVPGRLTVALGDSFPSYPERVARAEVAADRYEKGVIDAIKLSLKDAGVDANPTDAEGHLDCSKYTKAVKAR